MTARGGYLQGALHMGLTFHLREIQAVIRAVEVQLGNGCGQRFPRGRIGNYLGRLPQGLHRIDVYTLHHRGFQPVRFGDDKPRFAGSLRPQCDGQNSGNRAHRTIEGEFADRGEIGHIR